MIPDQDDTTKYRKRWPRPHRIMKEWIFPPPLLRSHITVLQTLAREGPTNCYQIAKKIATQRYKKRYKTHVRKLYSLVHKAIKELESRKMVTFMEERETRKGTTAKIYDLSLEGVLHILKKEMQWADTDVWNHSFIQKIREKYDYLLPLVFGKWKHFEEMKVGKIARLRLKVLVDTYAADPSSFRKGTGFGFGSNKDTEQLLCWFFYFQFPSSKLSEAWMTALKQDEEIKKYVLDELKAYRRRLKKLNISIDENISLLQQAE